jgi:D-glycero-alpha-D-manno-heptose-7-phosphate kinase
MMLSASLRPGFASAPLRLDFAGGWTDVPPFSTREGGIVVNATLGLYAHASVTPASEGITLRSEDLNEEIRLDGPEGLSSAGRLPLLQTAARLFKVNNCSLVTRSEAPAGSGLGSSGALDVALVSALGQSSGNSATAEARAEAAWRLEVVEAGIPGGKQDQWSAAMGGFRRFTFHDPAVMADRLPIEPAFLDYLERHMILCYTGTSRISGRMISRVVKGYEDGVEHIVRAFFGMKEVACQMAEALCAGDAAKVGGLLSANWAWQCRLDPGMRTDDMARLEHAVSAAGVLGGKAAGAGAGGCMFFLAASTPESVVEAAKAAGAAILPVTWTPDGVRVW